MARMLRSVAVMGLVAAIGVGLGLTASASPKAMLVSRQEPPAKETSPKKKAIPNKRNTSKKGMSKTRIPAEADTSKTEAPAATTPDDTSGGLKFSRDIAPILVANCARCHNEKPTNKSKFNQTTFGGLMKGGVSGKDIIPGNPEESMFINRIKGEGGRRMPPGNVPLADGAIARLDQWVREGAKLDAGIDANEPMVKYASTPEDRRKAEITALSPEARDKKTEAAARDRLKRADPNSNLTMTPSAHFLLFSDLPKERASTLLRTMEREYGMLIQILGTAKINFVEKVGLYVFKEQKGFTEFVRTVENQEVESREEARSRLGDESPYLTAIDPLAGGPEPAATGTRKGSRPKKGEESLGGPERSLAGLLTEQLVSGVLKLAGKSPLWVTAGVGALMASKVEPRSPYYRRLRALAYEQAKAGWATKSQEALGDAAKPEAVKAVGFAVSDWLLSSNAALFPGFIRAMLEGGPRLDEALGSALGTNREAFLTATEEFVAQHYGSGR